MAVHSGQAVREPPTPVAGGGVGPPTPPPRPTGRGARVWRWFRWVLVGGAALFLVAQAVPYGRSHTNPPVTAEPKWDSPQTRQLARQACFDCHSNLTTWPWYSNVAPVSWLIQRDVNDGRSALNFSEWNTPQDGAGDAVEAVQNGSMPPWFYPLMHPKANLSKADQARLAAGLAKTFQASPPLGGGGGG